MGILDFLGLGKSAGETISTPIEAIGNAFDKLFTSDDERVQAAIVLEKLRQQPSILQAEINKLEAQHQSTFVSGWRPSIGWVCSISLGCYYIPQFLLASFIWAKMCLATGNIMPYPVGQISGLSELVYALLGLGAMRTVEKVQGVTK